MCHPPPCRSSSTRVNRASRAPLSLSRKAVPRRRDITLDRYCGWSRFSSFLVSSNRISFRIFRFCFSPRRLSFPLSGILLFFCLFLSLLLSLFFSLPPARACGTPRYRRRETWQHIGIPRARNAIGRSEREREAETFCYFRDAAEPCQNVQPLLESERNQQRENRDRKVTR